MVSAGVNVDSFIMTASPVDPTPSPITVDPTPSPITVDATPGPTFLEWAYQGVPADVPGLIEAEAFDEGGEGSGYSDTTAGNSGGVSGND